MGKEKVVKDTAERWLLTYADLMNLLLIFFIILYAMSQIDIAKFDQMAASFKTVGISPGQTMKPAPVSGGGNTFKPTEHNIAQPIIKAKLEQQQMDQIKKEVEKLVKQGNLEGKVDVRMQERGVEVTIKAQLLFIPGSADIVANSVATVKKIGKVLELLPGKQIRIEGFTDSDPISTAKFASNWELSAARATNVLRMLIGSSRINKEMISSAGYGETRAVAPNNSLANKARNRRVNIVILKDIYDLAEPNMAVTNNYQ